MKTYKDLETLIAACVEERKRFERSAVGYLEFLSTVERDHVNLWKPACGTFDEFLERYVGLPRTSSYAEFKASLAAMGIEYVRECGAEAAAEAMRIVPAGKRAQYTEATRAWVKMHDGVHPSRETARELRRKTDPKSIVPRAVGQVKELEELRAENSSLKHENLQLTRERDKLRAENEKLRAENEKLCERATNGKPKAEQRPSA